MPGPALIPRLHLVSLLGGKRGARNALIRIRRLLDADLLVRRLAATAAHAKQPEEAAGHAKGDGEPDDRQHLTTHGRFDVVRLEHAVEDAGEHNVHGCCGCGSREYEDSLGLSFR
jgi:hypothetical protein